MLRPRPFVPGQPKGYRISRLRLLEGKHLLAGSEVVPSISVTIQPSSFDLLLRQIPRSIHPEYAVVGCVVDDVASQPLAVSVARRRPQVGEADNMNAVLQTVVICILEIDEIFDAQKMILRIRSDVVGDLGARRTCLLSPE